jgi:hypothetical protein
VERPKISPQESKMFQFQQRLNHIRRCIKKWNKEVFKNIFEEKRKLEKEMEVIQQQGIQGNYFSELSSQEAKIREGLMKRDHKEEILWKKKSKIHWLREGDKNTKFFHNSLIQRRNKNRIVSIRSQDGSTKFK